MAHFILLLVGAAVVGVIGFGVTWLVAGRDQGLAPAEPDDAAVPLPTSRPLGEGDVTALRFDTTMRGYRMGQVDAALRRAAYDIGYKQELINVLEAENQALRDGRIADADVLREARNGAAASSNAASSTAATHRSGDAASRDDTDADQTVEDRDDRTVEESFEIGEIKPGSDTSKIDDAGQTQEGEASEASASAGRAK
jgi:DivIVA domain-containing protein